MVSEELLKQVSVQHTHHWIVRACWLQWPWGKDTALSYVFPFSPPGAAEIKKQREFYQKLGMEVPGDIKGELCNMKTHLDQRNGTICPVLPLSAVSINTQGIHTRTWGSFLTHYHHGRLSVCSWFSWVKCFTEDGPCVNLNTGGFSSLINQLTYLVFPVFNMTLM